MYYQNEELIYRANKMNTILILDIENKEGRLLVRAVYFFNKKAIEVVKADFPTYKKTFFYGALVGAIEKMGTVEPQEKNDKLLTVQSRLQGLREKRDLLDEEEWHLITETIPRDMKTFRHTFHGIDDKLLQSSETFQANILAEWHRQIDFLEQAILERQLRQMAYLEELVKQRGKETLTQKATTKKS